MPVICPSCHQRGSAAHQERRVYTDKDGDERKYTYWFVYHSARINGKPTGRKCRITGREAYSLPRFWGFKISIGRMNVHAN